MMLYRRIGYQDEVSNYGDKHKVGIYEVADVELIHEVKSGYSGAYGEPCGATWWADADGHIYFHLSTDGMLYVCDDDTKWSNRIYDRHGRNPFGTPLTKDTPAW